MKSLGDAGIPFSQALRMKRGDVVSFVGGGGKTTSMFRLADELSAEGLKVVTTTTTHISESQVRLAPTFITPDELSTLEEHLKRFGHCLIVGLPDGKGRVQSVSPDLIASLKNRPEVDCILIEADGSRSLPFKAPGDHEPVVPEISTILVPVVGLNSIGQPLDEAHVHRARIVAALASKKIGSVVTAGTLARVLSHPKGGAKCLPTGARLTPLLNRADTSAEIRNARRVAKKLLANPNVDSVLVSCMRHSPPIREAWHTVAGIVLAAGTSTRFGSTKQVLSWRNTSLVAHSAQIALEAGLSPVIVVTGHDAEKVAASLSGLPVQFVFNPEFSSGQSTSLRKGVDALPSRAGAALFLLADQPMVDAVTLRRIVGVYRRTLAAGCVPVFEGRRGNPVLLDKALFPEVRKLSGDTGGRVLLEKYRDSIVEVPATRAVLLDIDTREDYEKLKLAAEGKKFK